MAGNKIKPPVTQKFALRLLSLLLPSFSCYLEHYPQFHLKLHTINKKVWEQQIQRNFEKEKNKETLKVSTTLKEKQQIKLISQNPAIPVPGNAE